MRICIFDGITDRGLAGNFSSRTILRLFGSIKATRNVVHRSWERLLAEVDPDLSLYTSEVSITISAISPWKLFDACPPRKNGPNGPIERLYQVRISGLDQVIGWVKASACFKYIDQSIFDKAGCYRHCTDVPRASPAFTLGQQGAKLLQNADWRCHRLLRCSERIWTSGSRYQFQEIVHSASSFD